MTYKKASSLKSTAPLRFGRDLAGWRMFTRIGLTLVVLLGLHCIASAQDAWQTETVDGGTGSNVGRASSLAIDNQGNLHIGYYDDTRHGLKYAFRASGDKRWFNMEVPDTAPSYEYLSMAVDAQGRPHFVFVTYTDGLGYTYLDGRSWHKFIIDSVPVSYFTSMQLDAEGHPLISYYQESIGDPHAPKSTFKLLMHLKNAYFDGQQWFVQTVDWRMGTGKYNAIAVDSSGNPHIAYMRNTRGELFYAHRVGKLWEFSKVDPGPMYGHDVGPGTSIALDGSGHPHIAYLDVTAYTVKYASWDGNKWNVQTVDHLTGRALLEHVSLKMDSQGRAHIAYYDAGLRALKYAVQNGNEWRTQIVDREGNVGMSPSMCLDARDQPYIAYYDVDRHALKLAHLQTSSARALASASK